MFDPEVIAFVAAFAVIGKGLVDALVTPVFEKYALDKFWLLYVAWFLAGVLVFLTGANLFASLIPSLVAGKILTAVCAGVLSNVLHDVSDKQ